MFYSSEENVDFLFIINPCEHIEDEHEMHSCNLVSSLVQYDFNFEQWNRSIFIDQR